MPKSQLLLSATGATCFSHALCNVKGENSEYLTKYSRTCCKRWVILHSHSNRFPSLACTFQFPVCTCAWMISRHPLVSWRCPVRVFPNDSLQTPPCEMWDVSSRATLLSNCKEELTVWPLWPRGGVLDFGANDLGSNPSESNIFLAILAKKKTFSMTSCTRRFR